MTVEGRREAEGPAEEAARRKLRLALREFQKAPFPFAVSVSLTWHEANKLLAALDIVKGLREEEGRA